MSLSNYASAWEKAEVQDNEGYAPLPNGTYKAIYDECIFDESKMMMTRVFRINEGDFIGRKQYDWLRFTKASGEVNEVSWSILKTEIFKLNPNYAQLPLADVIDLFLDDVQKQDVELWVKTSTSKGKDGKEYTNTNVRVNKFLANDQPSLVTDGVPS